jgi:hypothetical protein
LSFLDRWRHKSESPRFISGIGDICSKRDVRHYFLQETGDPDLARLIADLVDRIGYTGYVEVVPVVGGPVYSYEHFEHDDEAEGRERDEIFAEMRELERHMREATSDEEYEAAHRRYGIVSGRHAIVRINLPSSSEFVAKRVAILGAFRQLAEWLLQAQNEAGGAHPT